MSTQTARDLFDAYIKTEWADLFREGGPASNVKKSDGSRYVPTSGRNAGLRPDLNAWDEAIKDWTSPHDAVAREAPGYVRILEQAGPEFTWEGILTDPSRPWAAELRAEHPEVVRNIEAELKQRAQGAIAWQAEKDAEAERLALEEDESQIANMNRQRASRGDEPLTEAQEQRVRKERRERREKKPA